MSRARVDQRWSIAPEFCGYARPMYVLRFCGSWRGCFPTSGEARAERDRLIAERNAILSGVAA